MNSYTFRPSRFGRIAGARYRASQRVPYARRYGAFGPASRSRFGRARPRFFRPGFDRVGGRVYNPRRDALARRALAAPELKNHDLTHILGSSANILAAVDASSGMLLENIAQGVNGNQRIGRKIRLRSILLDGIISYTGGLANPMDNFYLWLVHDKQANGTFATPQDLFTQFGIVGAPIPPAGALVNLANTNRFRILRKWCIHIEPATLVPGGGAYAGNEIAFQFYTKIDMIIDYVSPSSGELASIKSNNISLMWAADNGGAGAVLRSRVRFTDV